MKRVKIILIELCKVIIIFSITFYILLYGISMMRNEYQQQLRKIEPEKAAEQVSIFNFFLN